MIDVLKELIDDIMTENRSYYDDEDRLATLEMIYPVVSGIVLNAHFAPCVPTKPRYSKSRHTLSPIWPSFCVRRR